MRSRDEVSNLARSLTLVEPRPASLPPELPDRLDDDYLVFLRDTNGGYTPDRMFHFFGASGPPEHDVIHWNHVDLWKKHFGLDDQCFVFAEDVFGNQYYYALGTRRRMVRILCFDDGSSTSCASDFQGFIGNVVLNEEVTREYFRVMDQLLRATGSPYPLFTHVSSKVPSCLGGDDRDVDNLEFANSIDHLNFMGQIVKQTEVLPPGTVVRDVVLDPATGELKLVI